MTAFKEFAIGKFVLRFYKTDHVWTCTVTEDMLDEVSKELALQRLSDIGQAIEQEPVAWKHKPSGMIFDEIIEAANPDDLVPLYTHPMRELTEDEIDEVWVETCSDFKLIENGKTKGIINIYDVSRAVIKKASEQND